MVDPSLAGCEAQSTTAYWTTGAHRSELRTTSLQPRAADEALVRTVYSGISRGTETLVHSAAVPPEVAQLMRAPFQEGEFPFPVKYGYLSVGVVEEGPPEWRGRRVFSLYPHQDRFIIPVHALSLIPDGIPDKRALLAGPVETALNALWDAPPLMGDRIAVVGAGIIGGSLATLLRAFPLQRLQIVDPNPEKAELAQRLGVEWAHPDDAMADCDIVYHASATGAGLAGGLAQLGDEGELIELSWYGMNAPEVPLGGNFHARRLSIRASQVGAVAAARRARRTHASRLELVFAALADEAFDALLGATYPFHALPSVMEELCSGAMPGLLHVITYPDEG